MRLQRGDKVLVSCFHAIPPNEGKLTSSTRMEARGDLAECGAMITILRAMPDHTVERDWTIDVTDDAVARGVTGAARQRLRRAPRHDPLARAGLEAQSFPTVTVEDKLHVVEDGDVIRSAGISAGIDMALCLVARYHGDAVARTTARTMEYAFSDSNTRRVQSRRTRSLRLFRERDRHERREHRRHDLLLAAAHGKHVAGTHRERPALLHHTRSRDHGLADGRREQVHLVFGGQHGAVGGHEAHGGVSTRRVDDGGEEARRHEPVLLGQIVPGRELDVDLSGRDANELRADRSHERKPSKALAYSLLETQIRLAVGVGHRPVRPTV